MLATGLQCVRDDVVSAMMVSTEEIACGTSFDVRVIQEFLGECYVCRMRWVDSAEG